MRRREMLARMAGAGLAGPLTLIALAKMWDALPDDQDDVPLMATVLLWMLVLVLPGVIFSLPHVSARLFVLTAGASLIAIAAVAGYRTATSPDGAFTDPQDWGTALLLFLLITGIGSTVIASGAGLLLLARAIGTGTEVKG